MTRAARSLFVFGIYLLVIGSILLGSPDTLLALLRLPPATDPWIRVLGVTVMAIGFFDVASARTEQTGYFRATVWVRLFVFISFVALVLLELAPAVLIVFGVIDAAGAVWTRLSLSRTSSEAGRASTG